MDKIITTGPESSGKTTLCETISNHFKTPFSKEYAREYLKTYSNYNQKDLMEIAKRQLQSEKNCRILDTDLITIKIWSNYKYGNCNKWILEKIESQKYENRFYLLCKPDIKWVEDPLRENPKNRMEIFELYKKEIQKQNHNYFIVEGENRAEKTISKIMSKKYFF